MFFSKDRIDFDEIGFGITDLPERRIDLLVKKYGMNLKLMQRGTPRICSVCRKPEETLMKSAFP